MEGCCRLQSTTRPPCRIAHQNNPVRIYMQRQRQWGVAMAPCTVRRAFDVSQVHLLGVVGVLVGVPFLGQLVVRLHRVATDGGITCNLTQWHQPFHVTACDDTTAIPGACAAHCTCMRATGSRCGGTTHACMRARPPPWRTQGIACLSCTAPPVALQHTPRLDGLSTSLHARACPRTRTRVGGGGPYTARPLTFFSCASSASFGTFRMS